MTNSHMKRCLISCVIRELKNKITMRYHCIRMATMQNTDSTKYWWGCGTTRTLFRYWSKWKMATSEESLTVSYKTKPTFIIWSRSHTLWYLPKWIQVTYLHKNLHMNFYDSFTCNYQNVEARGEWINPGTSTQWNIIQY